MKTNKKRMKKKRTKQTGTELIAIAHATEIKIN